MSKIAFLLAPLAAVLVGLLPATPAQAAARTFVSAAGSDSNNCTTTATPCRHLQAAYSATSPGGEIAVLDPANYGSLTITGPISIEGNNGWAFLSAASGANAITITPQGLNDTINIRGVVLDGAGIAGNTGIRLNGGNLTIRDSVIRNFGNYGLDLPSSLLGGTRQIFVSNTLIADNGSDGIHSENGGAATLNEIFNHVRVQNNGGNGIWLEDVFGGFNATITDSVIANNVICGILVSGDTLTGNVMVRNSTIVNNSGAGLSAVGDEAIIRVTRSTISGNNTGWYTDLGGVVQSYGDNNIDGNTNANTEPPNPLTYK